MSGNVFHLDHRRAEDLRDARAHRIERHAKTSRKFLSNRLDAIHVPRGVASIILSGEMDPGYVAVETVELVYFDADLILESHNIVLAGTPGNGKSLAAGLYVEAMDSGESEDAYKCDALFVNASRFDGWGSKLNDLEESCLSVSYLAIDDVGMGKSSSASAITRIESIWCERANEDLYTIVTTNLAPDDFWPRFGGVEGRLADRVLNDPIGWVTCLEPSRRRRRIA